jgi:hypothetical protein
MSKYTEHPVVKVTSMAQQYYKLNGKTNKELHKDHGKGNLAIMNDQIRLESTAHLVFNPSNFLHTFVKKRSLPPNTSSTEQPLTIINYYPIFVVDAKSRYSS